MTPETAAQLRRIKPVHEWLKTPELEPALARWGYDRTKAIVQELLELCRAELIDAKIVWNDQQLFEKLDQRLLTAADIPIRRVINATGILIHTGLGRSPLSERAISAITETAKGYCNLELDLATGKRGRRADLISGLIQNLTGAQSATVVNNNAAATILALRALAGGREVIVSRGQLVEIGGSFRLPDIMEVSGAILKEVGTTNKTRLSDYQAAVSANTAAILRVHTSNYEVVGFTEQPEVQELAAFAQQAGLWFIDDLGSGAISRDSVPGMRDDPTVEESVRLGSDLVLFSGDKLLGGPQCGIIAGKKKAVDLVEKDPLMRAFRVDKLTLAALSATLQSWTSPASRDAEIPLRQSFTISPETLRERAETLARQLSDAGWQARTAESWGYAGGGSLPNERIKSWAVVVSPSWAGSITSENQLAEVLRTGRPAILGRLHDGEFWLDLRAVQAGEIAELVQRFHEVART